MTIEIFTGAKTQDKSTKSLPRKLFSTLKGKKNRLMPQELLLSNDELSWRTQRLYSLVKKSGERTIKLDKRKLCRIYINPKNNSLEFRIGTRDQVNSDIFSVLTNLETIVQVKLGLDGSISEAIQGDIKHQTEVMLGPSEYKAFGNLYAGLHYIGDIDAIGIFTPEGPASRPIPDEIKQTLLQKTLQPVNNIIWQLTKSEHPDK